MAIWMYEREPYRRELFVTVQRVGEEDGTPFAILDDTICYPEGGGQPADLGRIAGVEIRDVQRRDGEVLHYLAAGVAEGRARLVLDWQRRFDHMQQHTAQHLLSALALGRFEWATRSFHIGAEVCDIELDVASPGRQELSNLEGAVNEEIRAARPIRCRRVAKDELETLGVRSRGLPEGHQGDVRLVEIEDVDLNTCGGTHLANTAEIEAVKLLDTEPLRGGCRLRWVAGSRVRSRLGEHEARNAELRRLLDTGDAELVGIVEQKLQQLSDLRREVRQAEERLADHEAYALAESASRSRGFAEAHYEGAGASFLRQVASRFVESCPEGMALVTCDGGGDPAFALAVGADSSVDLPEVGRRVVEALEGRGGGRAPIFQGKVGNLERRAEAVALARRAFGGTEGDGT